MKLKNLFFILAMIVTTTVFGQQDFNPGDNVVVTLVNGQVIRGKYDGKNDKELILLQGTEKVIIQLDKILFYSDKNQENLSNKNYKSYADQYTIFPSALPVESKKIYYRNIDLFANIFCFGISERFSLNFVFESISLINGRVPVMGLTPKFNIPVSDNLHFGVGTSLFALDNGIFGFGFGNATIGSTKNNITLGISYPYSNDAISEIPIIYTGYHVSLSQKTSIVGEVIIIDISNDAEGFFDISFRFKTKGGYAFDFGIARPLYSFDDDDFGVLPVITFTIPFN